MQRREISPTELLDTIRLLEESSSSLLDIITFFFTWFSRLWAVAVRVVWVLCSLLWVTSWRGSSDSLRTLKWHEATNVLSAVEVTCEKHDKVEAVSVVWSNLVFFFWILVRTEIHSRNFNLVAINSRFEFERGKRASCYERRSCWFVLQESFVVLQFVIERDMVGPDLVESVGSDVVGDLSDAVPSGVGDTASTSLTRFV